MNIKSTVTSALALVMISLPCFAQAEPRSEALLQELAQAETETAAARLERQVIDEWSKSGSATMDLLLKRGRDALEIKNTQAAIEHFRALTDHAPEFAEGWHGLALAYYQADLYGPAMDALERVLALNPHHFGALRGVGAVQEQVGRPKLAYQAYSRVLELRPHDSDVIEAMERLERKARGVAL